MSAEESGRIYDLVLFGATGYTGHYTAEYITKALPTNLKWAAAGRSHDKLEAIVAELKKLNPDRVPPAIELCSVDDAAAVEQLAKKTRVLISTVGPYGAYGEPVFKACAENGTHYLDVTGEVPFVASMISKYEAAARASGAMMFPQNGIESAPADLAVAAVARVNHTQLQAATRDVNAAIRIKALPSGGTLLTVLTVFDNFSMRQLRASMAPYALSPVPHPDASRGTSPLLSYLTGSLFVRNLGRVSTSMSGSTDAAQVERTWGLLASMPDRVGEAYGPNFSFAEYASIRTWSQGLTTHWMLAIGGFLLATCPPFRWLAKRYVFQPGTGPTREEAAKNVIEYRAVANPDVASDATKPRQQAFCHAIFRGSMYELTGILAAEGANTILKDNLKLGGGIYTPSFLGLGYMDRLGKAGFKFESKLIDA